MGLAVWGQPEGLRSSVPWAGEQCAMTGEWNAMAERTWEEVWAFKRSKEPLLWRAREGGWTAIGISLHTQERSPSRRVGHLGCRLQVARSHLLRLRETRRFLCRLQVARSCVG